MAVMMRSMLEVADNSGARKLQMILPLGGSTGLNAGLGDVITAAVKEAAPEGQAKKTPPSRWHLHPLRFECGGFDQRRRRAGGHTRVRSGGPRAAREKILEDRFAGAGSDLGRFRGFQLP